MRLVTWEEFKLLPHGTFYHDLRDCHRLGCPELRVFGGMGYQSGDQEHHSIIEPFPYINYGDHLAKGNPFKESNPDDLVVSPLGSSYRGEEYGDKAYKAKLRFLVWEVDDRERFARWILDPETMLAEHGQDGGEIVLPTD